MTMKPFKIGKGPLAGTRVCLAAQDRVVRLERFVDRVLDAVGHPGALVTDMSSVSDFAPDFGRGADHPANAVWCIEVGEKLGIVVGYHESIADVAERLQGGH